MDLSSQRCYTINFKQLIVVDERWILQDGSVSSGVPCGLFEM